MRLLVGGRLARGAPAAHLPVRGRESRRGATRRAATDGPGQAGQARRVQPQPRRDQPAGVLGRRDGCHLLYNKFAATTLRSLEAKAAFYFRALRSTSLEASRVALIGLRAVALDIDKQLASGSQALGRGLRGKHNQAMRPRRVGGGVVVGVKTRLTSSYCWPPRCAPRCRALGVAPRQLRAPEFVTTVPRNPNPG